MTRHIRNVWRGIGSFGAFLLAASLPAFGQTSQVACTASASPVLIRATGGAERVADVVVTCTGGVPTGQGQNVIPMTWILTFGSNVTSRPLASGWSEALLVVDEPQPANQLACATSNGLCTVTSTGVPGRTYDGSLGHPNIFQGEYGTTTLVWRGIPLDPPGSGQTRTFRFTNLRVVAPLAGGSVAVNIALASGQLPVAFSSPNVTVASALNPIAVNPSDETATASRLTSFNVNVSELFQNVLKPHSSAGAVAFAQSGPGGAPYDYETGFYNPTLPATLRGNLSFAGLPDNGTRVRIRLNGIATSTLVTAPLLVNFGASSLARLVTTDGNGIGPYQPSTSQTLPNTGGVVTAVYEIIRSSASLAEILSIPFSLAYATGAPAVQIIDGDAALAPFHPSFIADTSPIPRFSSPFSFRARAPLQPLGFATTSLLNGAVGSPYSQTIEATGGLLPYTITSNPVTPVPGLTLGTNGVLTGIPTTPGTFNFTVTVRDGTQSFFNRDYSLTIGPAGAALQTSRSRLEFNAVLGGAPPPQQNFRVTSEKPSQFTISVDGGTSGSAAPAWIQGSPANGATPGLLTVSVNQANLPEGTYTARIRVSTSGNPNLPTVDVIVVLVVKPVAAKLESSVSLLTFSARGPSLDKRRGFLLLRNAGGGGGIPFTFALLQRSSWIASINAQSNTAGPLGTLVTVNIDVSGLAEGIYRDVIRFGSAVNNVDVPIVLRVTPIGPSLGVSPEGLRFTMHEGARTLAVREIRVFNRDSTAGLPWNADLIRGSQYFSLAIASGIVKVSVNAQTITLPAGAYYGLVRITAPGVTNSPRYVTLVLQVRPSNQPPELDLDTGGLTFNVLTGSPAVRRNIAVNAATQVSVAYQAAASIFSSTGIEGTGWLSVSLASGFVVGSQSSTLTIAADPRGLGAGVYQGEVTVATADSSQTIPVTMIVTDGATDSVTRSARAATCSPNRMAVATTGLANSFTVPAGWPATLTVEVRDNCGAAISNATVVARFSNGDPPMTLEADDALGVFSGTWQPGTPLEQANVAISALTADFPEARAVLVGSVKENTVPTLFRNGTIHNLDPKLGGLLSPGLVAQVYGTGLAGVAESTGSVPLSTNYKNTTVLIGPYEAPLYYVSPGQLVVQLPNELPPNRTYPILVSANGALTIPDQIDVVPVQPGVAAFSDGKIIAQHSNFVLVDSTNPAKRGEFLIMYLVGLGGTNQLIVSGAPSPGTAPLPVLNVVPTVTIDGAPAQIVFAGLTPGGVALYQINFRVPDNARLNAPLDVVVRQGPYTANVTTLTVVP